MCFLILDQVSSTSTSKNRRRPTSQTTYSTKNLNEGLKEETSASDKTKIVTIAVTVAFLLVALALALVFFVYYIRRKR